MPAPAQVDSKVPRGKAAFHTLLPALAFVINEPAGPWIVGATGLLMAISVVAGPKFSLFGQLFNRLIRPRIGAGVPEEAAPHRFAEALGAVFLLLAAAFFTGGLAVVGWTLALAVAALAALNWLGGICVGCQMYLLGRRISSRTKAAV